MIIDYSINSLRWKRWSNSISWRLFIAVIFKVNINVNYFSFYQKFFFRIIHIWNKYVDSPCSLLWDMSMIELVCVNSGSSCHCWWSTKHQIQRILRRELYQVILSAFVFIRWSWLNLIGSREVLANIVNERAAASPDIAMAIFKLQLMCRKQNSIVKRDHSCFPRSNLWVLGSSSIESSNKSWCFVFTLYWSSFDFDSE